MILKIDDNMQSFNEIEESNKIQGIIGELKCIDIIFTCYKDFFEKLQKEINSKEIEEYDEKGVLLKKYNASLPNYSIIDGVYRVKLHLEEIEDIPKVTRIIIEGIDLEVLKFSIEKKEYDNNAIIINLVYKIKKENLDHLNNLIDKKGQYFEVICPEIIDKKIEMRYGKVMWSDNGEYYKYNSVLVEKIYDEKNKNMKSLDYPNNYNIMKKLSQNIIINEELLKVLKEKNIIDSKKEEDIKKKAENEWRKMMRIYNEVQDAEKEFEEDEI